MKSKRSQYEPYIVEAIIHRGIEIALCKYNDDYYIVSYAIFGNDEHGPFVYKMKDFIDEWKEIAIPAKDSFIDSQRRLHKDSIERGYNGFLTQREARFLEYVDQNS